MYSRREVGRMTLAALPVSATPARDDSKIGGVVIGVQSWSFRDQPLAVAIGSTIQAGLSYCELGNNHMEPHEVSREELRRWRLTVPLEEFRKVRREFDTAGIRLVAYSYAFRSDFVEEEIARGFQMARALGVNVITSSANISMAGRIDRYASEMKIYVGMHNHASPNPHPDEFVTPADFAAAMRGRSRYIAINLDVGHFWAAGFDPVRFIDEHHQRTVTLHLKDRKRNFGPNMPWGEGGTPLRQVLQLLKTKRYAIPAMIEYEYKGGDAVVEVRRCFEYSEKALA